MLATIRATKSVPHIWHRALGNSLRKSNKPGAVAYDKQRTFLTTDSFGAQFYRSLWKHVACPPPCSYEFGYLTNRSRVQANIIQESNLYRLRVLGVSAASTSYDTKSAFRSIHHYVFDWFIDTFAREGDGELLKSRYKHAAKSEPLLPII